MKTHDERTSPGVLLDEGWTTVGMALGDPKVRPLALRFKGVQEDLEQKNLAEYQTRNELRMAEGEAMLPAALCYEEIDAVQHDVEGIVEKDYQHPLYKALFPNGLTDFKSQSPEALEKVLPGFIQTLKDSGEADLVAHVAALEGHKTALKKPLEKVAAATTRQASADLALARSKKSWLDAYSALESDFNSAYPRRKKFVARFFPHAEAPKKKKVDPQVADLQKKNDELSAQVADLQTKLDSLASLLASVNATNAALTKQVADLTAHLAMLGVAPAPETPKVS